MTPRAKQDETKETPGKSKERTIRAYVVVCEVNGKVIGGELLLKRNAKPRVSVLGCRGPHTVVPLTGVWKVKVRK